jgi:hypothetical protein
MQFSLASLTALLAFTISGVLAKPLPTPSPSEELQSLKVRTDPVCERSTSPLVWGKCVFRTVATTGIADRSYKNTDMAFALARALLGDIKNNWGVLRSSYGSVRHSGETVLWATISSGEISSWQQLLESKLDENSWFFNLVAAIEKWSGGGIMQRVTYDILGSDEPGKVLARLTLFSATRALPAIPNRDELKI